MILTHAERTALQALADGLTATEYARQTQRSRWTIDSQLTSARQRLRARSTMHAIAIAVSLHEITAHLPPHLRDGRAA